MVTLVFKVDSFTRKISPLPFVASPLVAPFSPIKNPTPEVPANFASVTALFAISAVAIEPSSIERLFIF